MKKNIFGILIIINLILVSSTFYSEIGIANQDGELEIGDIKGGIGRIKADIKNVGDGDISDVEWSIIVTGGLFGGINSTTEDTITTIASGDSETIKSKPFFGFGRIRIKINADLLEKTVNGFILFFFIIVFPEQTIDFETVADGLNSPVACANAGDGTNRLFIADQIGKVYVIENDEVIPDPFLDISDKLVTPNLCSSFI